MHLKITNRPFNSLKRNLRRMLLMSHPRKQPRQHQRLTRSRPATQTNSPTRLTRTLHKIIGITRSRKSHSNIRKHINRQRHRHITNRRQRVQRTFTTSLRRSRQGIAQGRLNASTGRELTTNSHPHHRIRRTLTKLKVRNLDSRSPPFAHLPRDRSVVNRIMTTYRPIRRQYRYR